MQFVYVHVVEVKDSVWETNEQFRYFANAKSQCHKRGASPDNDIRFIELRFFRSITIMQLRLAIPADRLADILCSLLVSLSLSLFACLVCHDDCCLCISTISQSKQSAPHRKLWMWQQFYLSSSHNNNNVKPTNNNFIPENLFSVSHEWREFCPVTATDLWIRVRCFCHLLFNFPCRFFCFTLILFLSAFICAKLLFYSSAVHFCSFACEWSSSTHAVRVSDPCLCAVSNWGQATTITQAHMANKYGKKLTDYI